MAECTNGEKGRVEQLQRKTEHHHMMFKEEIFLFYIFISTGASEQIPCTSRRHRTGPLAVQDGAGAGSTRALQLSSESCAQDIPTAHYMALSEEGGKQNLR